MLDKRLGIEAFFLGDTMCFENTLDLNMNVKLQEEGKDRNGKNKII